MSRRPAGLPREPVLVAAAVVAMFLGWASMSGHGLDPSDEGYIVYPAAQVAAGLVPYRDINSLYTPLGWYLHAALFKVVGVELIALRVFFAAVAAGLGLGVYLLTRQFAGPLLAAVPLVAFALVFPIPQTWAPYPAWYALGGLLVSVLALGRWPVDRRRRWLVLAGLGCAFAFGTKPSLGLFGALACSSFLVLQARTLRRSNTREVRVLPGWVLPAVQAGTVLLVVAAFWLLVRGVATPGNQALLVLTLAAAGLVMLEAPRPTDLSVYLSAAGHSAWLVGACAAATLAWYVPLSAVAGWELTFDTIFRAGARTAWAFYAPILPPNRDALEAIGWIGAGALAAAGLAWGRHSGRLRGRLLLVALGGLALLGAALVVWRARGVGQEVLAYLGINLATRLARTGVEETDFLMYLPFLALWLAVGWLAWRRRDRPVDVPMLRLHLLVWLLAMLAFQLYPRASYRHLLFSIPPYLALAGVLRAGLWEWVARRLPERGWRSAAFALLLVFPALMLPTGWRERAQVLEQPAEVDLPHAGVLAGAAAATQLKFAASSFADLPPDAPVFVYPADPMVYLLTDHPNPTRESYLPAGYLDEARQRAVIERLEATRTRYVVWDQELIDRQGLYASDRLLVNYLWTSYQPVAAERAWVLLERVGSDQ